MLQDPLSHEQEQLEDHLRANHWEAAGSVQDQQAVPELVQDHSAGVVDHELDVEFCQVG